MTVRKKIGAFLSYKLKVTGNDRDWLAAKMGVTRNTIDRWMAGITPLLVERLIQMGEILNISPDEMKTLFITKED